MYAD
jgi:protein MAK16